MEHVKMFGKVEVVNKKDEKGDTILHIAAAKKQHEVFDLVLKGMPAETISTMEVNSLNKMGHAALDLLLLLPSEAGDREIEDIIRGAGGLRHGTDQNHLIHESNHQPSPHETTLRFFQYDAQRDSPSNVRNVLLLVVTLITTTTFQAGLSPPTFQNSVADQLSTTVKPDLRSRIDLVSGELSFLFMYCNTIAFFLSLRMLNTLIKGFPLIVPLRVSIVLLAFTYMSSPLYKLLNFAMAWVISVVLSGFGCAFVIRKKVFLARSCLYS